MVQADCYRPTHRLKNVVTSSASLRIRFGRHRRQWTSACRPQKMHKKRIQNSYKLINIAYVTLETDYDLCTIQESIDQRYTCNLHTDANKIQHCWTDISLERSDNLCNKSVLSQQHRCKHVCYSAFPKWTISTHANASSIALIKTCKPQKRSTRSRHQVHLSISHADPPSF